MDKNHDTFKQSQYLFTVFNVLHFYAVLVRYYEQISLREQFKRHKKNTFIRDIRHFSRFVTSIFEKDYYRYKSYLFPFALLTSCNVRYYRLFGNIEIEIKDYNDDADNHNGPREQARAFRRCA